METFKTSPLRWKGNCCMFYQLPWKKGFPCGSASKESACNMEPWVWSLGWEDPLEKEKAIHSSILAWGIPGLYSPCGHKELGTTEWLSLSWKKGGKFLVGLFRLWKQHILVCCEMTHLQISLLVASFKKRPEQGKALQVEATLPHKPLYLLWRLPPIIRQIQWCSKYPWQHP